ncbi:MAG: hypothetical protein DSY83_03810 [Flavobacteriia bacterium]|nr:MAG: hypothetical protein DSY83_03810 [Flavobacteriia bacterium]
MAIMGFLVHALKDELKDIEQVVCRMNGMTTYGIHNDQYIVVVAEAPSDKIDDEVGKIKELDGVLTIYATYMTVEDEMDENGNLETNVDIRKILGKKNTIDIS